MGKFCKFKIKNYEKFDRKICFDLKMIVVALLKIIARTVRVTQNG